MPFYVEKRGSIAVLHLDEGENRLNLASVTSILKCLDEIEANSDFIAMITMGHGKHYSLGLDLDWIGSNLESNPGHLLQFSIDSCTLYYRLVTFPIPTIAAINGHVYGAGTFLALSHDMLVMREDRGYFCLPEAKLTLPFRSEMTRTLVRTRVPIGIQSTALLSHAFSATEALRYGLIHAKSPLPDLLERCTHLSGRLTDNNRGLDRDNLRKIKQLIFDWATDAYSADRNEFLSPPKGSFSAYKSKL